MKVFIDAQRCQGHGRCFSLAPSVFGFDDLGNGHVLGDGVVEGESLALARLVEANCPEHAISIGES